MNLAALIALLIKNGDFALIAMNTIAQFGTPARRYQFAELMPERLVPRNLYRENGIRFRTIVANDGTRYSAVQKKDGKLVSSVLVELGESDIGQDITADVATDGGGKIIDLMEALKASLAKTAAEGEEAERKVS